MATKPEWHDVMASLGSAVPGRLVTRPVSADEARSNPEARRLAEARLRLATQKLPVVAWSIDEQLRVTSWSGAGLVSVGSQAGREIGRSLEECFGPDSPVVEAHRRALLGESVEFELAWRGRSFQAYVEPLNDAAVGAPAGAACVALDITDQHRAEEQLRVAQQRDGLTGLPNLTAFHEDVRAALSRHDRSRGHGFAVLHLNLDGFQALNQRFGYRGGDLVLALVARRLEAARGPSDRAARLGGDAFALLLEDVADPAAAARRAEAVRAAIEEPFEIGGAEARVAPSIGVAMAAPSRPRPEDMLRDAETAMYRAKSQGKGCFHVLDAGVEPRALALLRLEVELRRALERDDFRRHYEPSISAKGGKVTGFEILLWKKSQGRS